MNPDQVGDGQISTEPLVNKSTAENIILHTLVILKDSRVRHNSPETRAVQLSKKNIILRITDTCADKSRINQLNRPRACAYVYLSEKRILLPSTLSET